MATVYPYDNPDEWDVLKVGDAVFPGVVQSVDIASQATYEIVRVRKDLESRIRYKGMEPRAITVQILITNEDEFDKLENIKKRLYVVVPNRKVVEAKKVIHPKINSYGIKKVWYQGFDETYPDPAFGQIITISLLEELDPLQFVIDDKVEETGNKKRGKKGSKAVGASTNRDPATGAVEALS